MFDLSLIEESVSYLLSRPVDYEFRTTVVDELHDLSDFTAISGWIKGAKAYYLQAFTDRESVPYGNLHAPSAEKMREYAEIARRFVADTRLRGVD